MLRLTKRVSKSSSSSLELPSSLDVVYLVDSRFYLLIFAILCHEALVADLGEEESLVDGDVGDILVGGVGGALVGVPFLTYVGITALLLVVLLLLLPLSLLVVAPVTITRHWTFSNKVTGLTTFVHTLFELGL
jgi:hypothetical protein